MAKVEFHSRISGVGDLRSDVFELCGLAFWAEFGCGSVLLVWPKSMSLLEIVSQAFDEHF